jgi:glycosyltransferase involved in cell wall biosynthesis
MNVGIFSFTGDAPFLETGVTTYNRVLLRALCKFVSNNQYFACLSKNNSKRFSDLNFPNLKRINLGSDFFKIKMMKYRYLRPMGIIAFCFLMRRNHFLSNIISKLYDIHLPQEDRMDILIYTTYSFLPYLPLFVRFSRGLPVISVIHDIRRLIFSKKDINTRLICYYTKCLVENSTLVVVTSVFIKEKLIEHYGLPESKIRVLFSIPELRVNTEVSRVALDEVRKKYNLPSQFLFFPSTIVDIKNHLRLVKAIKTLKDRGEQVNLILSGTVGQRHVFEELEENISLLGLSKTVRYLGFVSEEEKVALFKLATCLIMPSIGESFSIPIWEGFYSGCPVASSNMYDMPEQVEDAGLLFDPLSIEDMADKIHKIWTDGNLRKELIRKGYRRVRGLTLENYARQWENIIEEAVGRAGNAR